MTETLYNTEILRLAASIPHHERLTDPQGSAERRSPICGSRVTVDIDLARTAGSPRSACWRAPARWDRPRPRCSRAR